MKSATPEYHTKNAVEGFHGVGTDQARNIKTPWSGAHGATVYTVTGTRAWLLRWRLPMRRRF
jgi:hypothetical protein